jgi:basic membrane lipoprotein Med (substrate-binding protein (PBP1-ABC) superfamily)
MVTDKSRALTRRGARGCGLLCTIATLGVLLVGCGNSGSSPPATSSAGQAATSASGKAHLKVAWIYTGPYNDGGWNVSHRVSQPPLAARFGSDLQQVSADNVPFTTVASNVTQRFIIEGANVVIDTAGYGDLFTKVCAQYPTVKCLEVSPIGTLPRNVDGYYAEHWIPAYAAGVAAGYLTKSGILGFVAPYNVPLVNVALNEFALGCQSVKPNCIVRTININNYFDPPVAAQAANSLIDAGADVLRGFTDDPTYCRVAQQRGVLALPDFADGTSACPQAVVTSTVWHWTSYYEKTVASIQAGTWNPTSLRFIPASIAFTLGPWGPKVPATVRQKVEQVFARLQAGTLDPFVGPIYDSHGKLRVPAGTKLTNQFLYSGWTWFVKGVVGG